MVCVHGAKKQRERERSLSCPAALHLAGVAWLDGGFDASRRLKEMGWVRARGVWGGICLVSATEPGP